MAGTSSTTAADRDQAAGYARRGLQQALALEQLAPAGDPDREHAEAALAVYPGRAVFGLITLTSKLDSLDLEPPIRRAAEALLLSAFDAANALWGFPEGRTRPRQLTASPHFVEVNVWRALETAIAEWSFESPAVDLAAWPHDGEPVAGRLSLFAGPSRELAATLAPGQVRRVLTVLPRPNQAYWTLSALWAAWLWGRDSAAPIRVALHRRRYDWAWHASALRTALASLTPAMDDDAQVVALMPEAEPGFVAAAALGLDAAGFEMTGQAMRAEDGQAVLRWVRRVHPATAVDAAALTPSMTSAARQVVEARGEPSPFACLHAAAWGVLAQERQLAPLLQAEEARALTLLNDRFEKSLADKRAFVRFGAGAEADVGQYWLADPATAGEPLADRVERVVGAAAGAARTPGSVPPAIGERHGGTCPEAVRARGRLGARPVWGEPSAGRRASAGRRGRADGVQQSGDALRPGRHGPADPGRRPEHSSGSPGDRRQRQRPPRRLCAGPVPDRLLALQDTRVRRAVHLGSRGGNPGRADLHLPALRPWRGRVRRRRPIAIRQRVTPDAGCSRRWRSSSLRRQATPTASMPKPPWRSIRGGRSSG